MAEDRKDIKDQISLEVGKQLQNEGIDTATKGKEELLKAGRIIALKISQVKSEVSADDVREVMLRLDMEWLGLAAGGLFRTPEWKWSGNYVQSRFIKNHARPIRTWIRTYGGIA